MKMCVVFLLFFLSLSKQRIVYVRCIYFSVERISTAVYIGDLQILRTPTIVAEYNICEKKTGNYNQIFEVEKG